jgi:serine/threonine protein kinase
MLAPGRDVSSSDHRSERLDEDVTAAGSAKPAERLDPLDPLDPLDHRDTLPGSRPLDDDVTVAALPPETILGGPEGSSPSDERPRPTPGMVLGRYMLLSELGSGGMGVVMAAYDRELDRRVALKLLRSGSGEARMRREAQALAQLQHPSVVTVYEVGSIDGQPFIAMEHVDGVTFDAWVARHRGQWRKIVEIAIRAGRGLAAAHAVGLVHRDVKPSNILVGHDGRVCVADFGIATPTGRGVDSDVWTSRRVAAPRRRPRRPHGSTVSRRSPRPARSSEPRRTWPPSSTAASRWMLGPTSSRSVWRSTACSTAEPRSPATTSRRCAPR